MTGKRIAILLSGGALLCLAACNRNAEQSAPATGAPIAALPLATAPPPPQTYAPPLAALPPASTQIAYRPRPERYRYLNDAYDMADAFGDTPPDYTVDYEGERPWIWRANDGAYRVVEWLPQGQRYYYYEPGADTPFLIEDPDYAYAYDDSRLVAVYRPGGALVDDRLARDRAYDAARYYDRARALYRAAEYERRQAAYAVNWRERAPAIRAQRERWARAQAEERQWRDWTLAHQTQESRWETERQHRMAYAAALGAAGLGTATALHRPARTPTTNTNVPARSSPATQSPPPPRAEPARPPLVATAARERDNKRPPTERVLPMPPRQSEPPPHADKPRTHDEKVRSLPEKSAEAGPPRERSPEHSRPPSFARFASTQSQVSPEPKTGLSARPDRPAKPALVRPAPNAGPAGRPTPQADMRRAEPHPTAAPSPRASPPVERPAPPPRAEKPRAEKPHPQPPRVEAPRAETHLAEAPHATPAPRPAAPSADRGGGHGKGKGHDKDRPH